LGQLLLGWARLPTKLSDIVAGAMGCIRSKKSDKPDSFALRFPKACFTKAFIKANDLGAEGFTAWVFHPHMLFGANRNWWGSKSPRPRPHEGVDLCLFRDGHDGIILIGEGARIPAMYDGVAVKIMPDFLGESIVLEHKLPGRRRGAFLTIYGHVVPEEGLAKGEPVKQGQVIASVASQKNQRSLVPPHLHLTIAWIQKEIPTETLDWERISNSASLQLLDPLEILDGVYVLLDRGRAPWTSPSSSRAHKGAT
jgi:murein DD-endopeptidase MepM/ murein hydrolase activator NlpD